MSPLIELEHLVDALKRFDGPPQEGRQAVSNLVFVGVSGEKDYIVKVEALYRSTKVRKNPVKIEVKIDKRSIKVTEKIKAISCSCSVSKKYYCKHAIATLIYLEKHDEGELESLVCIDVEQAWRKLNNPTEIQEKFEVLSIAENERNAVSEEITVLTNIVHETLEKRHILFKKIVELTADLYSQCSPSEKEYYDSKIRITCKEAENICLETVGQDNEAWKRNKFGRITGSICYNLYTYSRNKNPNWENKLDSVFKSNFQGNDDTDRGLMYESNARKCYSRSKGNVNVVSPGILIHNCIPWLGYSADGIVCSKKKIVCLWECKTPRVGITSKAENIKNLVSYVDKKTGILKERHSYYGQVQLGMLLYSLPVCDFTLYCCGTDEVSVESVMFNEKFCFNMVAALADVYFKQVLPYLCSQGS